MREWKPPSRHKYLVYVEGYYVLTLYASRKVNEVIKSKRYPFMRLRVLHAEGNKLHCEWTKYDS